MASFPRLKGSEYRNCSFRMKLLLIKEGNWTAVAKPEPVTVAWITNDEQALASIGLAVEDYQFLHIRKAKSAAKALENFSREEDIDIEGFCFVVFWSIKTWKVTCLS